MLEKAEHSYTNALGRLRIWNFVECFNVILPKQLASLLFFFFVEAEVVSTLFILLYFTHHYCPPSLER